MSLIGWPMPLKMAGVVETFRNITGVLRALYEVEISTLELIMPVLEHRFDKTVGRFKQDL
jgi:hypothetical protein